MTEVSDEDCEKALKSFAEITGTDEACAHFFLQDVDWQLQPALDRFFSSADEVQHSNRGEPKRKSNQELGSDDDDVDDEDKGRAAKKAKVEGESREPQDNVDSVTVLSWNVDGLDRSNLKSRFTAVCYIISTVSADVVFLQELAPELVGDLRANLGGEYSILLTTPSQPYFTGVLLKPNVELIKHSCVPFENSGMGRSMELVEASVGNVKLRLLNTHLESMKEHSDIRKAQLKDCFDQLREWDDGEAVIIFGGDLNIRDDEVKDVPIGFADAWVAAGSKPKYRFTWDTRLNDNKSAGGARCRFDRIFFKTNGKFSSVDFSLEGQNRIRSALCYPSDHWAIVAKFH